MYRVIVYRTARGEAPVDRFLAELPQSHQAKVIVALERLAEHGVRLGRPEVAHLKERIWELRVQFSGIQYRVLFAVVRQANVLLLHGFVKKSQAVPEREIRTSEVRLVDFEARLARGEVKL